MKYTWHSENYNDSWEIEEVNNLGPEYFRNIIQQVEENGIKVYKGIKNILDWWESGKSLTAKQAGVLMDFKNKFIR